MFNYNTVILFSNFIILTSLLVLFLIFFGIPAIETYLKFQTVVTEDIVEYADIGNYRISQKKFPYSEVYEKSNWGYFWVLNTSRPLPGV